MFTGKKKWWIASLFSKRNHSFMGGILANHYVCENWFWISNWKFSNRHFPHIYLCCNRKAKGIINIGAFKIILLRIFTILFIFRERGKKEREERQIDVREKHWSDVASHLHPVAKPTTQARALTGNWTGNLSLFRTTPNQATQVRAKILLY